MPGNGAAEVLDRAADLLDAPQGTGEELDVALGKMREALGALEGATTSDLPTDTASVSPCSWPT
ncbi:MAG: hypothetical protein M3Z06_12085 [Actinomycetota bacterium]|nr:hypothetical protein [Actinomycetota bacterium]